MSTDGLLNDNREEIKKKEFFEKMKEGVSSSADNGFTIVNLEKAWDWIQAYVKEEVARVDNSALVEGVFSKAKHYYDPHKICSECGRRNK